MGLKTSPPNHIWGLCVDAALWSCATRSWPRHIAGVHRNVESRIELWGLFIQPLFNVPKWGLKVKDCRESEAKVEILAHGPEEEWSEDSENPPLQ